MTDYPAHIYIDPNGTRVQSCTEHSRNSARYAAEAVKEAGFYNTAYFSGLIHDMGKFKSEFSEYIKKSAYGEKVVRGSVVHTFAGVRYILSNYCSDNDQDPYSKFTAELTAYAVGAHHGLFDCVDEFHKNGFKHRLEDIQSGDAEAFWAFEAVCANKQELDRLFLKAKEEITEFFGKIYNNIAEPSEAAFTYGILARLIASAVMEGDRRDTAEFMRGNIHREEANPAIWERLLYRVESKIREFPSDTPINRARGIISDRCRKAADLQSGIYRLNVPTGGGKTLSSLRYALAHAAKYGKKRIVFTSPLLSILDQNSNVIRDFIGNDELILEHHSNVLISNEETEREKYFDLTDNWSTLIIVTTLVQLLNTMFDGKTSSVRRFNALSDAVIVIDEVQTVPKKLLSMFDITVSFLANVCRSTIILCSATQPCLERLSHPIRGNIGEIMPYDEKLFSVFKRTQIRYGGEYTLNDIPKLAFDTLEHSDSLLIICNKKKEASSIYELMKDEDIELFHLSASMCTNHRKEVLENIKGSFSGYKKTVCISTQVIEAGVDISFGAVIRLCAGMDSIIQAAGRCNRNRESEALGDVIIVKLKGEDLSRLPDIEKAKYASERLIWEYTKDRQKFNDDLASDKSVEYYYKCLFNGMDEHEFDYPTKGGQSVYSMLSQNEGFVTSDDRYIFCQAFESAGRAFSAFDSNSIDVIVPYGRGEYIISELLSERAKHNIEYIRELIEEAKGYTIALYSYQVEYLEERRGIIPLAGGIMCGISSDHYDKEIGFNIKTEKEENDRCNILML